VNQKVIHHNKEAFMKIDSWKEKKDRLFALIDNISKTYGGDEQDWLAEYKNDVLIVWKNNLNQAITCFELINTPNR
jgi:hypothetical protein